MNKGRINFARLNGPADTATPVPPSELDVYPDPFLATSTPTIDPFAASSEFYLE